MSLSLTGMVIEWAVAELVPALLAEVGADAIRRVADRAGDTGGDTGPRLPQARSNQTMRIVEDVVIVSSTPGRLRLAVAGLRGSRRAAIALEGHLAVLHGVQRASTSAITGNVLVEFDPSETAADSLCASLRRFWTATRPAPVSIASGPRLALVAE